MASGHMNRVKRPDTWLHRPMLRNVKKVLAKPEPSTHDPERSLPQSSNDRLSLAGNFADDLAGRPHRRDEADALSGPQRHRFNITFGVCGRRVRLVANDLPAHWRYSDSFAFPRALAGRRTARCFPGFDCLVPQRAMRSVSPADVEQIFEKDRIVLVRAQKAFAISLVNWRLFTCKKACSDPGPGSTERQSCG